MSSASPPPSVSGRPARIAKGGLCPPQLLVAVVAAACLLVARPARGGNDPNLKWLTMTTPHFYIHFWEPEYAVALRVARLAEVAHQKLVPVMEWVPRQRTHIVITDEVDSANGSATALPYNTMRLFVTAPEPFSTLNDYDDWLLGLILHEYTHILHIDNIRGLARWVNALLGKVYAPNQLQPRWFIEGLATFEETIRTSGGRQRNSIFDMYLRMSFLENRVQRIDQISHGTIRFPGGNAWYLYGSSILRFIAERYGERAVAELSRDYGSRAVPFSFNRSGRKVLGKTYTEIYDEWRAHMSRRYERTRRRLQRQGLTPLRRLTFRGERVGRPNFTPDGTRIIYDDNSGRDRAQIAEVLVDPPGRPERQRPRTIRRYFGSYPTIARGGRGAEVVVYQQNEPWNTYYFYDDLFALDRRRDRVYRLTHGRRAREPNLSADGRRVTYVINNLGTTVLAVADLVERHGRIELENERIVLRPKDYEQVATPAFSPDGREIAYSRWSTGGFRDIHVFDLTTGQDRALFRDRAVELDPRYSPDGRYLYFTSDRTGIYNLYAYDRRSGELFQVTNVLGGVFAPDISPDGKRVVFVGFTSYGYDLFVADLDATIWRRAAPYVDERPSVQQVQSTQLYPVRRYSALPTLRAFRWAPGVSTDPFGGNALTLHADGGDVVGWYGYSLDAVIGFARGDAQLATTYTYRRLWPDFVLGASRFIGPRGGFIVDGIDRRYIEETWTLAAGVNLPLLRTAESAADLAFNYNLSWFRAASSLRFDADPNQYLPVLPEVGRHGVLSTNATYSNARSYQYSISPEEGRTLSLGLRFGHPYFGGEFRTFEVTYSWTEYLKAPWVRWLPHHVFAFRYGGGFGTGDFDRRGLFFISGFPGQDIVREFFFGGRVGGATLRGYPFGAIFGDQYHLWNFEYRFPIIYLERGYATIPLYIRRIHGSIFYDVGNAFFGGFDWRALRQAAGFELSFETLVGYVQDARIIFGYAHGFQELGTNQTYFHVGFPF